MPKKCFNPKIVFLVIAIISMVLSIGVSAEEKNTLMSGNVVYHERIAMYPNSIVHVMLIDLANEGKEDYIVAQTTVTQPTQVPVAFSLEFDRTALKPNHDYEVRAAIISGTNHSLWLGKQRISAIDDLNDIAILTHAATDNELKLLYFSNENITVQAYFSLDSVYLLSPDYLITLPQVISASGAKYSQDGVTFWTKGKLAYFDLDAYNYELKVAEAPQTKTKGIAFKGIGQEPGWYLDIYYGDKIVFVTDYGTKSFTAPLKPEKTEQSVDTIRNYKALTSFFNLAVVIEPKQCFDSMTGEPFPYLVTVYFEDKCYKGCGREIY